VESVRPEITIVYNDPYVGKFKDMGEERAILGILECVNAVNDALLESGYKVNCLSLSPPLNAVKEQLKSVKTGLLFNLFEGFYDDPESEAEVANIFEDMGFTFTGCPPKPLELALDKIKSKTILAANDIPAPPFQKLSPDTIHTFKLDFPCIVKPVNQDASHGISRDSVVYNTDALKKQVLKICDLFNGEVIVEKFLNGREFNVCVIGNEELTVLPVSEIVYNLPRELPDILTFDAKWFPETEYYKGTVVECPAKIDEELKNEIASVAMSTFRIFECLGYARVDLRLDQSGVINVMEVNPNPDISQDTGAARQANAAGMSYTQFIDKIALLASERVYA
jgi:D-alanine-D-alanine ligase